MCYDSIFRTGRICKQEAVLEKLIKRFETKIVTMANKDVTARIQPRKQDLEDAYAPPANFLEIDVLNPETHGVGNKRYTDYELRMRVNHLTRIRVLGFLA